MARKQQIVFVFGFVALMVYVMLGQTIPVAGQADIPQPDILAAQAAPLGPFTLFLPNVQGSRSEWRPGGSDDRTARGLRR